MRWKFSFAAFFLMLGGSATMAQVPPPPPPQEVPVMPQSVDGTIPPPGQVMPLEQGAPNSIVVNGLVNGCNDCNCNHGPSWMAIAKFLYLKRNSPAPVALITQDPLTGLTSSSSVTVFNASQYNFDMAPGADISISRQWGPNSDIQIRYFGFYSASADSAFTAATGSEFAGQPATLFLTNTQYATRYTSSINSVEFNVGKSNTNWIHWQIGVRWLNLAESVSANSVETNGLITNTFLSADNNLWGGQIGADGVLWDKGRWGRVVGWGKAGLYYNEVSADFDSLNSRFPPQGARGSGSGDSVAFVGELGLDWQVPITRNLFLNLGGQVMWLNGVATASDQIAGVAQVSTAQFVANTSDIGVNPQTSGSLLLYGFNVGLVYTW